jgi:hypothetical protein
LVACAFLVAYVVVTGALTYVNVVVFRLADAKFLSDPFRAWVEIYWPLWAVVYLPAAATALLAAWYSRLPLRSALAPLGAFIVLISVAMEASFVYHADWPTLLIELVVLSATFFLVAWTCRKPIR